MQPAVQAGGGGPPSCPPHSGHDSSKQLLKSDSDHPPATNYSASGKSRKRERGSHQTADPQERDRSAKPDDNDSKRPRRERINSSNGGSNKIEDMSNFLDKSGVLFNSAGVDRLYDIMLHHDLNDNSRQFSSHVVYRTWLAGLIVATDREDCLSRFFELGGLALLDEWLQETHRGKVGGGGASSKETEKNIEDLLLNIIKALEKLPVDLDALKSCNAGKSVNNLRCHKNPEIHKRAKKLVDTWKKKVGAELDITKSSSVQGSGWTCKPAASYDSSHLLKCGRGSVDGVVRFSGACTATVKVSGHNNSSSLGEVLTNPIPMSLGKTSPAMIKENSASHIQSGNNAPAEMFGGASVPDERSSNNQSLGDGIWSNGPNKSAGPLTNVSANSKAGNSTPHVSAKENLGIGMNGTSKDVGSGKPLVWSRSASTNMDKSSSMSVTSDKSASESAKLETSSNQRSNCRVPSSGRNNVLNAAVEGGVTTSRSSPLDRHSSLGMESFDGRSRSQTTSCIEDARAAIGTRTPGPDGIDKIVDPLEKGNEEMGRQCRTGEVECHSSESQLSFSSTQCCTASFKESPLHCQAQWMDDKMQDIQRKKGEKSSGRASDAENTGISLLACVAADESSRSGKDVFAPPVKNKHLKDTEHDREKFSADSIKQQQNTGAMHARTVADATDAKEMGDCHRPSIDRQMRNSGVGAVGMGQSDENTAAGEEIALDHRSPKKNLEGTTLPRDDRTLDDLQNDLSSSPSGKSHGDQKPEEREVEPDLSRDYGSPLDMASKDALDKKQLLHHPKRTTVDTSFTISGSGRYGSSGEEDNGRDEKDDGTKTATEPTFRFPGEDALDVAVQVAMEVKQEMEEKHILETETSHQSMVISKDNIESQVAKECKPKLIDCLKDAGKSDMGMHSQLDGNLSAMNAITCQVEGGNTEKCDSKAVEQPTACPPYKERENSACSSQAFDGWPHEPNKLKYAVDEAQHGIPSSSRPFQSTISNLLPEVLAVPNSTRSRTATPDQTTEVALSTDIEAPEKHDFDLNEGIMLDEGPQEPAAVSYPVSSIPSFSVVSNSAISSSSLSVPIAVVASTKGAFIPPASPLKGKGELGWRGSAATSAFRPAEPRRTPDRNPDKCQNATEADGRITDRNPDRCQAANETGRTSDRCQAATETDMPLAPGKRASQPLFDFDLNVADEGLLEEGTTVTAKFPTLLSTPSNIHSSVKLDLDLNRADESEENGPALISDHRKTEVLDISSRNNGSSGGAKRIKHDFDLNDGLCMDDTIVADDSIASQGNARVVGNQASSVVGLKMAGEMINLNPWSHTGGPIPAVAMPAYAPVRPESPFSVAVPQTFFSVGQGQAIPSFHTDIYRPPNGFSSSTAAAFSYPMQSPGFPYTGYPFGFSSASFPAVSASFLDSSGSHPFTPGASQILTSGAILPPHIRHPYLMGLTKIPTPNNDRIWPRQNLDLNSGPETFEAESKEERAVSKHVAVLEGPLITDGQTRVIRQSSASADSFKRKEPEVGWDLNRFELKQEIRR